MSGEVQRQRNMEIAIKEIRAKVGPVEDPIIIHLHDFAPDSPRYPGGLYAEDSPHISVNKKTGQVIKLIIHPYKPEEEKQE